MSTCIQFLKRPHAAHYMAGALYPAWRKDVLRQSPSLSARWQAYRAPGRDVQDFARLCALPMDRDRLPPLFVHATAFRLQMALLAHRSSPFPIWRVLQVRNQLLELVPVAADTALDFECRLHAHRGVQKGLEVDLHTRILAKGVLVAESLNTFYIRGLGSIESSNFSAPSPSVPMESVAAWRMSSGGSWRFGALTGDYNPAHIWNPYARLMGFRRAFFHPLRVVGHSLARSGIGETVTARRVDVWMKGPVYHDSAVELRRGVTDRGTSLAVLVARDPRPAVITHVHPCTESDSIVRAGENVHS